MFADLHAITVHQDPAVLRRAAHRQLAVLLACGINPEHNTIFRQSDVGGPHCEAMWILGTVTPYSRLLRMTQFKDKTAQGHSSNLGLFAYPVLMAADVLLYRAQYVPVGNDQKQHLELMQAVAQNFNSVYNQDFFPIPKGLDVSGIYSRIMSLKDGRKKMSKSDPSPTTRIDLIDTDDAIRSKIMKAKTDAIRGIYYDKENRPDISNLLTILSAVSGTSIETLNHDLQDVNTKVFKETLADATVAHLKPLREGIDQYLSDPLYLDSVLDQGAHIAAGLASDTVEEMKSIVGLR
eukprot:TRINITY_DN639_c0_g1_i2.p1 TRINITY_DN639_c0_g1~~TRINITY_DN639_c0_g1_i2.p1  ORF type:complete len:293 (+),score=59.86 TRINITY_DN639_c0_g1_i2:341-1219(+)